MCWWDAGELIILASRKGVDERTFDETRGIIVTG
jgi:hypothetical protein